MTQEKIKEGNKLIACFDGWEHSGKGGNLSNYYYKDNGKNQSHSDDFEYNSSWDWLMPVVERIEDLNGGSHNVEIKRGMRGHQKKYVCEIYSATEFPELVKFESDNSKLETLFTTVVMFLKVYNKLKSKNG